MDDKNLPSGEEKEDDVKDILVYYGKDNPDKAVNTSAENFTDNEKSVLADKENINPNDTIKNEVKKETDNDQTKVIDIDETKKPDPTKVVLVKAIDEETKSQDNLKSVVEKNKKSWPMYLITSILAVVIIAAGYGAGRYVVPIDDNAINTDKELIQADDKSYQSAKLENSTLNASIKTLEDDNSKIATTFDDVLKYQNTYEKLTAEEESQKSELETVKSQLNDAQAAYDTLQDELKKIKSKTVTLSPGTYTVGTHIPDGNYTVSGNGTFLVADKNNISRVNTILAEEAYECKLTDGDIIKLETEAKFVPKEG